MNNEGENTVKSESENLVQLNKAMESIGVGKYVKFSLPPFSPNDPDVWFAASEHIFATNSIKTENEKFSYLLQSIGTIELANIRDIIASNTEDKYTQARKRLSQVHGKSKEEKIQRLLTGAEVDRNEKPSVILAKLKYMSAENELSIGDDVIRSIWIQNLPERIVEFLAAYKDESITKQVKIADDLHEYEKKKSRSVETVSVPEVKDQNSADNLDVNTKTQMDIMMALLQNLTSQVAEIKNHRSRSNERNTQRRANSPFRPRQRSRSRPLRPFVKNGICTYHFKFGENAYKCMPGCKHYRSGNE